MSFRRVLVPGPVNPKVSIVRRSPILRSSDFAPYRKLVSFEAPIDLVDDPLDAIDSQLVERLPKRCVVRRIISPAIVRIIVSAEYFCDRVIDLFIVAVGVLPNDFDSAFYGVWIVGHRVGFKKPQQPAHGMIVYHWCLLICLRSAATIEASLRGDPGGYGNTLRRPKARIGYLAPNRTP